MAKKKINFDLFQLSVLNEDAEDAGFEDFLLAHKSKYFEIIQSSNPVIMIDEPQKEGNLIFGTLAHNQMNDLPPVVDNLTRKTDQLPITTTQGLAYYTSFLFDKELQIIVYEAKQNGVSFKSFCEFYEANYKLPPIEAHTVVDPIEIKRLNEMTIIRKFSVKIAKLQYGTIFSSKQSSIQKIIKAADNTNNSTIEYSITSPRLKNASLSLGIIKQTVRDLLRFKDTEEVQKLEVTGKMGEDDQNDMINFITNRYRIAIEVERKRFSQSFALKEKYKAMESEYKNIRPELKKAYGK